jgi:aminoglycoside 6'-N-acetyltransferase
VIDAHRYSFRHARADDMPMLRNWLATPEVTKWWGDPVEQERLVANDIEGSLMTTLVISLDADPFAYAQYCAAHDWPQTHLAHLPMGTQCVDALVGRPEMIGKGHGRRFLKLLAERIISEGAPIVVIDPDPDNVRARRAYAAAGFAGEVIIQAADGPCVLMIYNPRDTMCS